MYWAILVLIFAIVVLIVVLVYGVSFLMGLILARGVPFVSLSRRQLRVVDEYIKLNPDNRVVDLGCGDGRVLRMFEKQGVKNLTGYEINFWAYLLAKIKNKILKSKAKICFKNFKKVDLSEYNIIFCYLLPGCVNFLKEKFDRELKPGTKIISYVFEIKNWHKPEIIYTNEKNKNLGKIFVYKINN